MKLIFTAFAIFLLEIASAQNWQRNLGRIDSLITIQKYKEADKLLAETLLQAEKEFGKASVQYALTQAKIDLTKSTIVSRKKEMLSQFLERVEVISTNHPGTEALALAYYNLANFCFLEKKFAEGKEYALKSLQAYENLPEYTKIFDYTLATYLVSLVYDEEQNWQASSDYINRTVDYRREIVGTKNPWYHHALYQQAVIYRTSGNYFQARQIYKEIADLTYLAFGEKSLEYTIAIYRLGNSEKILGNLAESEKLLLKALSLRKEISGENHPLYASYLNDYAILLQLAGNYTEANEYLKQALQIREGVRKNDTTIPVIYNNIGYNYLLAGEIYKAEPSLIKAEKLSRSYSEGKGAQYAAISHSLATMYFKKYFFAKADSIARVSLAAFNNGSEHTYHAHNILGEINFSRGEYEVADFHLKEAGDVIEKFGAQSSFYIELLHDKALLYWGSNQLKKANESFLALKEQSIKFTLSNFSHLTELEKERFFDNKIRRYVKDFNSYVAYRQQLNSKELKNSGLLGEMYNFQLFSKALLLNASAKWKKNILASSDKKLISKFLEWENLKKNLAIGYQNGIATNIADSLEQRSSLLEKELLKVSERYNKASEKKIYTWQEVQAKLKKEEAAIEIIRLNKYGVYKTVTDSSSKEKKQYPLKYLTDTIQYAALITTLQSNQPHLILFENGNQMERQLKAYRNSIKFKLADNASYDLFWKPIAKFLKSENISKAYLSPDGLYNQISLNTLYNPLTKKYLADEVAIHLMTNTKDLLTNDSEVVTNQYAAFVGNPEFEKKEMTLPGTQKEIQNIVAKLNDRNWEIDTKLGKEAQEKNIKELYKPKVLHIATHGYFEANANHVAEDYSASKESANIKSNPLWRSGLILSKTQANVKEGDEPPDDGILTAYEAMNLNLDGTELVVLSACETGLGEVKYGEGVYGLQRAFKVAGARNIIMSLWKVDDQITQEMMSLFYEKWLETQQSYTAFTSIQNQLKEKYRDPYFWGGFVLIGD